MKKYMLVVIDNDHQFAMFDDSDDVIMEQYSIATVSLGFKAEIFECVEHVDDTGCHYFNYECVM